MRAPALLVVLPTALVASLAVAPPATAAPTTVTSVTMVSETGAFVGDGRAWLFSPSSGGSVRLGGGPGDLTVDVSRVSNDTSRDFSLRLLAPPGEVLEPGTYEGVQSQYLHDDDRAGLNVSGNGRACDNVDGRLEVLDIVTDGNEVVRLHALYEQHCDGRDPAVFGEIRYQVPVGDSDLLVAPGHVRWPLTYPGVEAHPVPVTRLNTKAQPVELAPARVVDDASASFRVVHDACPAQLEAGASCQVHVRFVPAAAGTHTAVLALPDGSGGQRVQLSGEAERGTVAWRMRSQTGDWVGAGASYDWTPVNALISAGGDEGHVRIDVLSDAEEFFTAEFAPGRNDVLLPGRTYDGALRYPFHYPRPGLDVRGDGRGCSSMTGRFTVHEIAVGRDGLEKFSVTFELHCEGEVPALLGSIAFRADDGLQPLPGVGSAPSFSDTAGDVHEDAIVTIAEEGITRGYLDGTYRPGEVVTRGQMASFLSRALDLPSSGPAGFADTGTSAHRSAIDAVAGAGIARGYDDGTFRPDLPVTREQMATFLTRALRLPPGEPSGFRDTSGSVHLEAIDAVAAAGIAVGRGDGTFGPRDPVTRGQMATFLVRALFLS